MDPVSAHDLRRAADTAGDAIATNLQQARLLFNRRHDLLAKILRSVGP